MKMYLFKLCISFLLILFSANNAFSRDITIPPDTTTNLLNKTTAIVIIEEAKELFNQGKVRDALIKFREAAIKDPNSWRAIYWVSQCQYSMNNFGLALKYALEAVSLKQEDVDNELYELLARSYHRMGEIDSALVNYNIALTKLSQMRSKELQIELRIEQCMFAKAEMAGPDKSKKTQISSLNSGFNDYCPIIVNSGKGIYFTSRRSNTSGGRMNPDDQEYFEDTYYAIWNAENNDWDSITNELGRINSDGFDAITYISKDGLYGLMTINNTATDTKKTTKGSDIFSFEMSNKNKWSTPKRINSKSINTSFFEGSATMTADGNTLYFVSDRKGDKSSTDIYMSQKIGKSWGDAKALPFTINTIGRETTPFITGDGRYLFFSSDGRQGMGGLDIYVVENLGSTWGEPINLGIMVNSVNNDSHFQYYPELNKAVMSSFEILGQKASMDIYQVDMTNFVFPTGK
jgi:tetratricopeptide (TPR) repeat protein